MPTDRDDVTLRIRIPARATASGRMFGRARSQSTSPLTPNATARASSPATLDLDALVSRASNCLADASSSTTGTDDDDGARFAGINEARRLIETIRARSRDATMPTSKREAATAALGMLEEMANDAVERAARGRFRSVVETPETPTTPASGGLDLFSGLTLADAPSVSTSSPSELFALDADAPTPTPDSSWRREKPKRIGYGRRDEGDEETRAMTPMASSSSLMPSPSPIAPTMVEAEPPSPPPPIFDEAALVASATTETFEFERVAPSSSASDDAVALTPVVGGGGVDDDDRVEFERLMRACDVRFKPAKLAFESAEARREAALLKRRRLAAECARLIGAMNDLKRDQERAIGEDDYEAAGRLQESIEGAKETLEATETRLRDVEHDFVAAVEEAIRAKKTWIDAHRESVSDVTSFCESKKTRRDDARSIRERAARDAAAQKEARREALERAKAEADAEATASADGAETLRREKEALEAPIRALTDEVAALRASLEAKERELEEKEAERRRLADAEDDSRRRVEEARASVEAAESELRRFDDDDDAMNEESSRRTPDASEDAAQRVIDEAELATTRFAESLERHQSELETRERLFDDLSTFIERETSAREEMCEASSALERAREEKVSAEAAGKRLSELESRLRTLEASKADAVSRKRFSDAQEAATEIKTVLEQIDAARASTQTDVIVALDAAIALASRRLADARAAAAKARLARLRAESSTDTADAIALVRLLHGDVLEDLADDDDDDAS